jgi:hypothetical protein
MGHSFEPGFWSRVLEEKGLESPGREEAVKEAIKISQLKKENKKKPK